MKRQSKLSQFTSSDVLTCHRGFELALADSVQLDGLKKQGIEPGNIVEG